MKIMYMANVKVLRLVPNATYIPLTRIWVLHWGTRKIAIEDPSQRHYPTRMVLRRSGI